MTNPGPGQFTLTAPDGTVIAQGSLSALTERVLDSTSRTAAETLLRDAAVAIGQLEHLEEREDTVRQSMLRHFCDSVAKLGRRLDAEEMRRRDKARRDAEEEQRQINELEESELESLLPGSGPSGDLHSLEAKTADNGGSLPLELERTTPPPPANYPTLEDKPKPQVPQPISVSLNAADPEEDYDDA